MLTPSLEYFAVDSRSTHTLMPRLPLAPPPTPQFSINYMHHGAAKQWYGAPTKSATLVEMVAATSLPEMHHCCRNFLRHKTTLLSPEILVSNGVPLCHLRQTPGDFVVTFPRAYHFGFNFGLNCAESTNFALHSWLPFGRTASRCTCRGGEGLASIDMARFDAAYDPAGRSPSKRPLLNPGNPARACGTVGCTLPDFHDGACTTRLVNGQRRSTSSTSSADSSGSVSGDSSRYDVDASHGGDRSIGGSGGSGGKRKAAPPERERSGMRLQKSPRGAASQTVLRAAAVASERDGAHGRIVSSRSDDEDNDDGSRSGELSETREFSSPLSACSAGGGSLAANSGRRAGYYAPIGLINKLPPGPYVPFGDADRHRRERVKESRGGMDASAGPPMAVPHMGENGMGIMGVGSNSLRGERGRAPGGDAFGADSYVSSSLRGGGGGGRGGDGERAAEGGGSPVDWSGSRVCRRMGTPANATNAGVRGSKRAQATHAGTSAWQMARGPTAASRPGVGGRGRGGGHTHARGGCNGSGSSADGSVDGGAGDGDSDAHAPSSIVQGSSSPGKSESNNTPRKRNKRISAQSAGWVLAAATGAGAEEQQMLMAAMRASVIDERERRKAARSSARDTAEKAAAGGAEAGEQAA